MGHFRLLVVHIPPVPERVVLPYPFGLASFGVDILPPCVIPIFYHRASVRVNNFHYISLLVFDIVVNLSIVRHQLRSRIPVVEEVNLVCFLAPVVFIFRLASPRVWINRKMGV